VISAIVIVASLVLATAFALMYALRPGLREEIERPKHWFQNQLDRYDRHCQNEREAGGNDR